jgi:GT2 family glycosyltransferase
VLARFEERLDLELVRKTNGGPASARNAGLQRASEELVAFTDDDCHPEATWLERLIESTGAAAAPALVGGAIYNALPERSFSEASQLVLDLVYDHYNRDPAAARFVVTMNLLAPRAELVELGGFDAGFRTAEDRELCDRWLAAGYRMVYAPAARVGHAHPLDLRGFCRQHFGYGRGADRYHRVRAARDSGSLLEESSFHLELPRLLIRRARSLGGLRLLTLMPHLAVWQLANAGGFLWSRMAGAADDRSPADGL